MARRTLVLVPLLLALARCDEVSGTASEVTFGPAAVVWQTGGAGLRAVVLVEGYAGRSFAFISAQGADGAEAVYQSERVGTTWLAPVLLARPGGATSERVQWATSVPAPALLTLAEGTLYVREFVANDWGLATPVTLVGAESVQRARLSVGLPTGTGRAPLHVVYSVADPGACAQGGGARLLHRASLAPGGWFSAEPVASVCGLGDLAFAAGAGGLMAVWTAQGDTPDAPGVWSGWSRSAAPASFLPPQRIQPVQGNNLGPQVVPAGGGFLATWQQAGSPRRAVYSAFDPNATTWTTPDVNWFQSALAPFPAAAPGGALVLAAEADVPLSRLTVRRWRSPAQPLATQSGVYNPAGAVTSTWLLPQSDGSLQAAWVELLGNGGPSRVLAAGTGAGGTDAGTGAGAGGMDATVPPDGM